MQAGGSVRVKPGKNDWRTGPDDTLQVVNPKSKKVQVSFTSPAKNLFSCMGNDFYHKPCKCTFFMSNVVVYYSEII
jgi:hypothetical protein